MSMESIRRSRGVPAKRGGRITYTGGDQPRSGTILSARNGYLRIRFDGEEKRDPSPFHPTWELTYENGK